MLFALLWFVVALLVVLWLIGLLVHFAGGLIYLLLVVAAIVLLFNLFFGRHYA